MATATVTRATVALSVNSNLNSVSNISLVGMNFKKDETSVTITHPPTSPTYKWTGLVHKVSTDGTMAEVKVTQQRMFAGEGGEKPINQTGAIKIVVDNSSEIEFKADLYNE